MPFTEKEIDIISNNIYLLLGSRDPFEKLGREAAVKRRRLNAMFFEEAGHGINHEEASEVNRMIIRILKGEIEDIRNYNI
jgi:hypothetical protein